MNYKMTFEEINLIYPVEHILRDCGVGKIYDKGTYFLFSSPFRDDKKASMALYKYNLYCLDFGGSFAGSLYTLYKQCTGSHLNSILNKSTKEFVNENYFNKKQRQDRYFGPLSNEDFKTYIYEGSLLYDFSKNLQAYDYLKSRFIDDEFIKEFKIGYTRFAKIYRAPKNQNKILSGTTFKDRICIPMYYNNELMSIEGRDFTKKQPKKVVYPIGGSTSFLFNYDRLNHKEPLVVVEGIMDLVRIWKYFTKNVTTTFGIGITSCQKELLNEFKDIILFPDTDEGGRRMITNLDAFYQNEFRIAQMAKSDPGDPNNSIQDIGFALENNKTSTEFYLDESELFTKTNISSSSFFGN